MYFQMAWTQQCGALPHIVIQPNAGQFRYNHSFISSSSPQGKSMIGSQMNVPQKLTTTQPFFREAGSLQSSSVCRIWYHSLPLGKVQGIGGNPQINKFALNGLAIRQSQKHRRFTFFSVIVQHNLSFNLLSQLFHQSDRKGMSVKRSCPQHSIRLYVRIAWQSSVSVCLRSRSGSP